MATCELCGEPMPPGEEMFKFHGYSGPCPKPPLPKKPDPLKPSMALLVKIGSIAVHADEMLSAHGHDFDRVTTQQLIADPEVKDWIDAMTKMAMLPVKRNL